MNDYIYYYLLAVNILAFVLFGIDKQKARRNLWRIPEKTLLLSALIGGSAGAILGMQFFHHKTYICSRCSGDTGCGDCCSLVYTDNVNNSCLSGSGV